METHWLSDHFALAMSILLVILTSMSDEKKVTHTCPQMLEIMSQIVSKFNYFWRSMPDPFRRVCCRNASHGCSASIIQFHHLLNVDHTSNTFSDDNSALHQEVTK